MIILTYLDKIQNSRIKYWRILHPRLEMIYFSISHEHNFKFLSKLNQLNQNFTSTNKSWQKGFLETSVCKKKKKKKKIPNWQTNDTSVDDIFDGTSEVAIRVNMYT